MELKVKTRHDATPGQVDLRDVNTLAKDYQDRFDKAPRGRGYHNCASFVKYLIGLSSEEKFVQTEDASEKGLIRYLRQKNILPLSDFNDKDYLRKVAGSDVIGILHNNGGIWRYLHFAVPNPDPNKPFKVFQRNGFEEAEPEVADIRDVIKDPEYLGDSRIIFFNIK